MDAQTPQIAAKAPLLFNIIEQAFRQIAADEAGKILTAESIALALHNQLEPMVRELVTDAIRDAMLQLKDAMYESTKHLIDHKVSALTLDDIVDDHTFERKVENAVDQYVDDGSFEDKVKDWVRGMEFGAEITVR